MARIPRDLFGQPIRNRKPRLQATLERYDRETLPDRIVRAQRVHAMFPKGRSFIMPFETAYVFEEARMTFVHGLFVSTILLAVAFAEHRLADFLTSKGRGKDARAGLKAICATLRHEGVVHEVVLGKLDRLREIRNPFVHVKEHGHKHLLSRRMVAHRIAPEELLRQDAEEALSLMYQVALYPLR